MDYEEDDLADVLEKKNRYGRWQSRWVVIEGPYLKYWKTKGLANAGAEPSAVHDCRDVASIQSPGRQCFDLLFKDGSKVSFRASKVEVSSQWVATVRRKSGLSPMRNIAVDDFEFQTSTFSALMILGLQEQTQWINDNLDEAFRPTVRNNKLTTEQTLRGAIRALASFVSACEDCSTEAKYGEPRATMKCKGYMNRYMQLLEARLVLMLQPILSKTVSHEQLMTMGPAGLGHVLQILKQIEKIKKKYAEVLPAEVFTELTEVLVSTPEVISAVVNAGVVRMDQWWAEKSASGSMSSRLGEAPQCLQDFLSSLDPDNKHSNDLIKQKVCTAMLLSFSDRLSQMNIDYSDESALATHINSCETCVRILRRMQDTLGAKVLDDFVLDAVASAAIASADVAAHVAVKYFFEGAMQRLLEALIQPTSESWLEGETVVSYTRRVDFWLKQFTEQVVASRRSAVIREAMSETVYRYFAHLISRYRTKHTFQLDELGVERVVDDAQYLQDWMQNSNEHASEPSDLRGTVEVIRTFQQLITSPPDNLVLCYVNRLRLHGGRLHLHMYDIVRFCLKIRADVDRGARKQALATCAEAAEQAKSMLRHVDDGFGARMIRALTPEVGTRHCTGKPWSMERAKLKPDVVTFVTSLMADAGPPTASSTATKAPPEPSAHVSLLDEDDLPSEERKPRKATSSSGEDEDSVGNRQTAREHEDSSDELDQVHIQSTTSWLTTDHSDDDRGDYRGADADHDTVGTADSSSTSTYGVASISAAVAVSVAVAAPAPAPTRPATSSAAASGGRARRIGADMWDDIDALVGAAPVAAAAATVPTTTSSRQPAPVVVVAAAAAPRPAAAAAPVSNPFDDDDDEEEADKKPASKVANPFDDDDNEEKEAQPAVPAKVANPFGDDEDEEANAGEKAREDKAAEEQKLVPIAAEAPSNPFPTEDDEEEEEADEQEQKTENEQEEQEDEPKEEETREEQTQGDQAQEDEPEAEQSLEQADDVARGSNDDVASMALRPEEPAQQSNPFADDDDEEEEDADARHPVEQPQPQPQAQPKAAPTSSATAANPFDDDDDDVDAQPSALKAPAPAPRQQAAPPARKVRSERSLPVSQAQPTTEENKQDRVAAARAEFGAEQTTIWTSETEGRYAKAKEREAKRTKSFTRSIAAARENW